MRVSRWRFIENFGHKSLKKPQKVDFWSKKVEVYSNFAALVV